VFVVLMTARRRREERLSIYDRDVTGTTVTTTRTTTTRPVTGEFAHMPRS
jgi:hypothetical protein